MQDGQKTVMLTRLTSGVLLHAPDPVIASQSISCDAPLLAWPSEQRGEEIQTKLQSTANGEGLCRQVLPDVEALSDARTTLLVQDASRRGRTGG